MSTPDEPRDSGQPQHVWKSQTTGPLDVHTVTNDQLNTMARSREKLNLRVNIAIVAGMAILSLAFLYNVYRLNQPWLRLGQAWTLAVIVYIFGSTIHRGKWRAEAGEPCIDFLERQHERRSKGYLIIRRRLFLFLPGIAASWVGGGPPNVSATIKPWLFAATLAALSLVWLALGKAAEKARHEAKEIAAYRH